MLTIMEDTTEGAHDTLIAACDRWRYEELGGEVGHRNCADNLVEGLQALRRFLAYHFGLILGFWPMLASFLSVCRIWEWEGMT